MQLELSTILGAGVLAGATVAWLIGRINAQDWLIGVGVALPMLGLQQKPSVPVQETDEGPVVPMVRKDQERGRSPGLPHD